MSCCFLIFYQLLLHVVVEASLCSSYFFLKDALCITHGYIAVDTILYLKIITISQEVRNSEENQYMRVDNP